MNKTSRELLIPITSGVLSIGAVALSTGTMLANEKYWGLIYLSSGLAVVAAILSIYLTRYKKNKIEKFDPRKEKKVFISYAREDSERVAPLYYELKRLGMNPWMDVHDIKPGDLWKQEIEAAIKSSDLILLCFSKNSVHKKGFIAKEIDLGLQEYDNESHRETQIIPVKLDESEIPKQFSMFQFVDLTNRNGWNLLIDTLRLRFNLDAASPTGVNAE